MAYDKAEIIAKALLAIETEECVTIEEVLLFLPISKQTFYTWGLDEIDELKDAIHSQKIKVKQKLRRKWRSSDNPVLQIAEFKLISTDEERDKLSTSKVHTENSHTIKGKPTINLVRQEQ